MRGCFAPGGFAPGCFAPERFSDVSLPDVSLPEVSLPEILVPGQKNNHAIIVVDRRGAKRCWAPFNKFATYMLQSQKLFRDKQYAKKYKSCKDSKQLQKISPLVVTFILTFDWLTCHLHLFVNNYYLPLASILALLTSQPIKTKF